MYPNHNISDNSKAIESHFSISNYIVSFVVKVIRLKIVLNIVLLARKEKLQNTNDCKT